MGIIRSIRFCLGWIRTLPSPPGQDRCGSIAGSCAENCRKPWTLPGGPEYDVYNAIRLLADRTRFDILCYLRDRDAYGQELAAKFGLSRNTIHHHMTKLLAAHLVKCSVDGNRVYYTVDQVSVAALMDRQRDLLLPDHTKK